MCDHTAIYVSSYLYRDEKRMERRMRDKTRNWAALSDEQGSDADAPKLSEMERHEVLTYADVC